MTLEEFINEKLCPAGVVTAWDDIIINTAFLLDDMETITSKVGRTGGKSGGGSPRRLNLNINDNMKIILQNEEFSRVITVKDGDIDLDHYDDIWDVYLQTEFAGRQIDVCITGDKTDYECPGIDYSASVRVEAYDKESDTNLFECRSPIIADEHTQELHPITPDELIRQMAQIAVPMILDTRFIRDFSCCDADFVRQTDAKHSFFWLVRENGTELYDLVAKRNTTGFTTTMDLYRDKCCLFFYDGLYLRPITPTTASNILKKHEEL